MIVMIYFKQMVAVAASCVRIEADRRPSMRTVWEALGDLPRQQAGKNALATETTSNNITLS